MKNLQKIIYITVASFSLSALMQAKAQIITQWNFTSTASAPDNSPTPTTGSGTAVSLGMTNTYTYAGTALTNSVTSDDILSSPGVANPSFVEDTWRIRGAYVENGTAPNNVASTKANAGANVNGWNLSAPQYSQGAEFDVSTVGFSNISVSFDWYSTNQGIRDLQEQYTLNGTTWININPLQIAVPNDFDSASNPTNTIKLSGVSGASNDANFGIRLVSAYDPTFTSTGSPTYTSASLGAGNVPVQYNNNSGNWRFGDITFSGTQSVPEPSTYALMLAGFAMLMAISKFRRRNGVGL